MATLKDIGAELSLSAATVSRALNGFPEVNAVTRAKVQETAERLGYRPNRVAQRLVTGRSGMVGMIIKIRPDMSADQTFFEVLTGLTAALAARDTDLVLAVDESDDPVAAYERLLERDILDGFILNAPLPDDLRVSFLRERGIPFVMHGRTAAEVDYPFYDIDNAAVSSDAVRLLSALGHRKIALVNGQQRYAFALHRLRGFRTAMEAAGIPVHDALITSDAVTEAQGYATSLAMFSAVEGERPTAFVCATTLVAAGVMRAAKEMGLRVPQDVSIIAHDDAMPLVDPKDFEPALTVTRSPIRDACVPLADFLIDQISGSEPKQLLSRAVLIERQSTGPAPVCEAD